MKHEPLKPFLTYEKQIDHLMHKKGLRVPNPSSAISSLQDISYYALIDGYKDLFYKPMTRCYENGTNFGDIINLYRFDEKLRSLLLRYICRIEQKMRSLISYTFCENYSIKQDDYLNPHHYNYTHKNQPSIHFLIKILSNEANRNQEHPYIVHHRKKYGNVPLWVIQNTLTFGQTSKMYSLLPSSLQTKISKHFKHVNEKELSQYLKVLTHFRNICAHNERLFSFRSRYEIPNTPMHQKLKIPQIKNQYLFGKSDVFVVVISFRYLLSKKDFSSFVTELRKLFFSYSLHSGVSQKAKLMTAMGFPKNWTKNIPP